MYFGILIISVLFITGNITAVITYQEIGEKIAELLDQNVSINMRIIEGRSVMRTINTLNK